MILVTRQSSNPTPHRYILAGQAVMFDAPVLALAAFQQTDGPAARLMASVYPALLHQANAKLQYHGMAPIAGREQHVSCWRHQQLLQIDVGGQAVCQVDLLHRHIHLLNELPYDDRLNLEIISGPALILLLAEQGIFCLHAGAVATSYGNIALIAESGVGKSTLSAHKAAHWQQLADDIVPLIQRQGDYIVGDYPQLKLAGSTVAEVPDTPAAISLVLRLCVHPSDEITFSRLHKKEAMLQIVRHSVAAKLYDNTQLQAHADFAHQFSLNTPVVELSYPRDLARLDSVRAAITDYLRAGNFN